MAQARPTGWLPSGGVLAIAFAAAVVAAILVNVYVGRIEDRYTNRAMGVLQLKRDIPAGEKIRPRDIEVAFVSEYFRPAFARAFKGEEKEAVEGRVVPRRMYAGEILFAPHFLETEDVYAPVNVPQGYQLVTVPIAGDASAGRELGIGSYVSVWGDFNTGTKKSPSIRPFEIIRNVKISTLDGRPRIPEKLRGGNYDTIGIQVRDGQVRPLMQVLAGAESRRFRVNLMSQPSVTEEAQLNEEVLRIVEGAPTVESELPF